MPREKKSIPKSKEKGAPKKLGRPTKYTPEMVELICSRVATHDMGLRKLTEMYGDMPDRQNINEWRRKYPDFRDKYMQAKAQQIEFMTEDIVEIADDSCNDWIEYEDGKGLRLNTEHVQRSRLRIDTRKWLASKIAPKIYGKEAELQEKIMENESLKEELAKLRAELDEKYKKDY